MMNGRFQRYVDFSRETLLAARQLTSAVNNLAAVPQLESELAAALYRLRARYWSSGSPAAANAQARQLRRELKRLAGTIQPTTADLERLAASWLNKLEPAGSNRVTSSDVIGVIGAVAQFSSSRAVPLHLASEVLQEAARSYGLYENFAAVSVLLEAHAAVDGDDRRYAYCVVAARGCIAAIDDATDFYSVIDVISRAQKYVEVASVVARAAAFDRGELVAVLDDLERSTMERFNLMLPRVEHV